MTTIAPSLHSLLVARCSFGHLRSVSSRSFFSLVTHGPRLRPRNKPDPRTATEGLQGLGLKVRVGP
jgi:hypothetical protein